MIVHQRIVDLPGEFLVQLARRSEGHLDGAISYVGVFQVVQRWQSHDLAEIIDAIFLVLAGDRIVGETRPITLGEHIIRGNENLIGNTPGHRSWNATDAVREPKRTGIQASVTERVGRADDLTHDVHASDHAVQIDKIHDAAALTVHQDELQAVRDIELPIRQREPLRTIERNIFLEHLQTRRVEIEL